ncbi:hypothetical protein NDU88_005520 [Pleurodeles waltl]|uniref:Uncharacterized protein n=1 Tax=Pleurodeles waltl TaxID=8319 RepID=A0AAV7NWV8_PLEWA|nr:hypothetical protein NDU88_005520 [Pleurodeles waltl]
MGGPGLPACTRRAVHKAGRSPGAFFSGRPATGIRRRGPVQAPPEGLSPFFQPAAHAISSAIGLASVQPGASRSPSCFPFPGSAWSPGGHKMQDFVFFFAVRDPRETQGHRGVRNGVFQLPRTALTMGG